MLSDREKMDEWRKQQMDLMAVCVEDARKILAGMPGTDELGLLHQGVMNGFIPRIACRFFLYRLDALMTLEDHEIMSKSAQEYFDEVMKLAAEKTG